MMANLENQNLSINKRLELYKIVLSVANNQINIIEYLEVQSILASMKNDYLLEEYDWLIRITSEVCRKVIKIYTDTGYLREVQSIGNIGKLSIYNVLEEMNNSAYRLGLDIGERYYNLGIYNGWASQWRRYEKNRIINLLRNPNISKENANSLKERLDKLLVGMKIP